MKKEQMLQVERTASTKVLRWKGLGVFEKVTRRHSADARKLEFSSRRARHRSQRTWKATVIV